MAQGQSTYFITKQMTAMNCFYFLLLWANNWFLLFRAVLISESKTDSLNSLHLRI